MVESTVFKTEHEVFLLFGRHIMHLKMAQNYDVLIVTPGLKNIKKRNRNSLEKKNSLVIDIKKFLNKVIGIYYVRGLKLQK
jgi:hypothetical protein